MSRAPEQVQDPLRWCAALALAFWLACLPYLTAVPHPYFDEVHYLPAARELLVLGEFTNREHPLLGKQLIALGIALFGDNPVGWRLLPTLLGTLALFGAMRALWFASASRFATLAYEEVEVDGQGVTVVQSGGYFDRRVRGGGALFIREHGIVDVLRYKMSHLLF